MVPGRAYNQWPGFMDCSLWLPAEIILFQELIVLALMVQFYGHLESQVDMVIASRFGLSRHMTSKITGSCGNKRGRAWYELVTIARINHTAEMAYAQREYRALTVPQSQFKR